MTHNLLVVRRPALLVDPLRRGMTGVETLLSDEIEKKMLSSDYLIPMAIAIFSTGDSQSHDTKPRKRNSN